MKTNNIFSSMNIFEQSTQSHLDEQAFEFYPREVYYRLVDWKDKSSNTVLYLTGVRQCGKTELLREFGKNEFRKVFYIKLNNENDKDFEIVQNQQQYFEYYLEWYTKVNNYFEIMYKFNNGTYSELNYTNGDNFIFRKALYDYCNDRGGFEDKEDVLIIIDEIQYNHWIYNTIRDMARNYKCKFAVSGSYLNIAVGSDYFQPVGDVNIITLRTLSFREFLATNKIYPKYRDIRVWDKTKLTDEELKIYKKVEELFNVYLEIGGYPAVIKEWYKTGDLDRCRQQIKNIYNIFIDESRNLVKEINDKTLFRIINQSLIAQLVLIHGNKTFKDIQGIQKASEYIISDNDKTFKPRQKEIKRMINWLASGNMLLDCGCYKDYNTLTFEYGVKYYFNDIGVFNYVAEDIEKSEIQSNIKGIRTENFVYLYLLNYYDNFLSMYNNRIGYGTKDNDEIDFIIKNRKHQLIGVEVKSGNEKASFLNRAKNENYIEIAIKLTNTFGNADYENNKFTVPIFAIDKLDYILYQ